MLIELNHERNNHNHPMPRILPVAERACLPSKQSKPGVEVKPDKLDVNEGEGAGKRS